MQASQEGVDGNIHTNGLAGILSQLVVHAHFTATAANAFTLHVVVCTVLGALMQCYRGWQLRHTITASSQRQTPRLQGREGAAEQLNRSDHDTRLQDQRHHGTDGLEQGVDDGQTDRICEGIRDREKSVDTPVCGEDVSTQTRPFSPCSWHHLDPPN